MMILRSLQPAVWEKRRRMEVNEGYIVFLFAAAAQNAAFRYRSSGSIATNFRF